MKLIRFSILLIICSITIVTDGVAQTRDSISYYFSHYQRPGQKLKPSSLASYDVNHDDHTINISVDGGFAEQAITSEIVNQIYDKVHSFLPDSTKKYHLVITSSGRKIEDLVPNYERKKDIDKSRTWQDEFAGRPWVSNASSAASYDKGFRGSHLALWQSHGKYYSAEQHAWQWQRPRLYCTTEDLFSQTFVLQYLIPMLENAGAIVYTPRERNWQNNEVIVDNDQSSTDGLYTEDGTWSDADSCGFAYIQDTYAVSDNPFSQGTARISDAVSSAKKQSSVTWMPYIPQDGDYAVYVSYQSLPGSISDAHYQVWHEGIMTEFVVNQQMGGSTWVYLGTFHFDEGFNSSSKVVLTNLSKDDGVVSADAVRFGSGMGNILGGNTTSGMPRWAEAARYYTQWAGLSRRVYDSHQSTDDYKDDLYARPWSVNELAGGSLFSPDSTGRKVPFELALAIHTDAGYSRTGDITGSLGVCTTKMVKDSPSGSTSSPTTSTSPSAPIDRFASYDLISGILSGLSHDLKAYAWPIRPIWDKDYCETREPNVPSVILEMLSHENFFDMCLGYDPQFKFDLSRSVYKSVLRYVSATHNRDCVIQPLPIRNFAALLSKDEEKAELSWAATEDTLESSAAPQFYVVYTRIDDGSFDNGTIVKGTSCKLPIEKGHIYSYKVVAGNKGGISFPSEILSVYSAPQNKGTILIVNAFTRLEGPAQVCEEARLGFDLDADPGVQLGLFAGFCGRQKVFSTKNMGSTGDQATGRSGNELEGQLVMGNTFDYPYIHGQAIRAFGSHSFCSASAAATTGKKFPLSSYALVDVICGVQKQYDEQFVHLITHLSKPLLITGAHLTPFHPSGPLLTPNSNAFCSSAKAQTPHFEQSSIVTDPDSVYSYRYYSEMNPQSYSVPSPSVIQAEGGTPLLLYPDHTPAAVLDRTTLVCGVPFETITSEQDRTTIMSLFLKDLLP